MIQQPEDEDEAKDKEEGTDNLYWLQVRYLAKRDGEMTKDGCNCERQG